MKRLRTQYMEPEEYIYLTEENNLPSMTEPNMSLTPIQILERFASNRPVAMSSNLEYTGEEYLPDIRTMDLVEISDLMESNAAHISELKDEIDLAKKRKKELESKKAVDSSKTEQDEDPA